MNKKFRPYFVVVLLLAIVMTYVAFFGLGLPGSEDIPVVKGANHMRFGIDIRGGVDVVFQPKDLGRDATNEEMDKAREIIETRLDGQNILDRDVTVDYAQDQVFVRYPWKSDETDFDPQKAIEELGSMARLTFRDPSGNVLLDGSDIANSYSSLYPGNEAALTGTYVVNLEMTAQGATKFAEATESLIGQRISIYMDEILLSDPTVNVKIPDGKAYITGQSSQMEAQSLASRINSGSLPFALETRNYSTISPTLGAGALDMMLTAGLVAFGLVILFLVIRYRLPGVVALISLTIQVMGTLMVMSISQLTVTLPGLAGIILTVGMGVDANIIITERIREELRAGKTLDGAIFAGFDRAFSSVFDGNITVLIVGVVLWLFGSGSMLSFAYTLLIGIIFNFVAGVGASRLMILSLSCYAPLRKRALYVPKGGQTA